MIHPSPRDQRDVPHNRDVPPSSSSASFTSPPKKKTIDKQSVDYVLRSGLAGGLAGCAAKSLIAPLDRVKILFQASSPQYTRYAGSFAGLYTVLHSIYHQDGISGLFRGHSATLLRIFPYAAIKFLAYEQIRHVIIPSTAHETPLRRLLSGSLAGVTSVFVTYPLEVIRVRLAFETGSGQRSGLGQICRTLYRERPRGGLSPNSSILPNTPTSGLANFYRGFGPTVWGMLPYAGFSFLTHDTAGDLLRHPRLAPYTTLPARPASGQIDPRHEHSPAPLRYWAELSTGALAGLVSQTAAYPFEVIRRRMQVGGAVGDGHRLRMRETMGMVYREKGTRGFFVGLGIGYLKVVPMVATSFFVYERGKLWLGI